MINFCGKKKESYSFEDLIKGLQYAVNCSQEMVNVQQLNQLTKFFTSDGKPETTQLNLNGKTIEVPLMALVPHKSLTIDELEVKFKARFGNVVSNNVRTGSNLLKNSQPSTNFMTLKMDIAPDTKVAPSDLMEVTVRFKSNEPPEGMARLLDQQVKEL